MNIQNSETVRESFKIYAQYNFKYTYIISEQNNSEHTNSR